jgi:hypothetical protein
MRFCFSRLSFVLLVAVVAAAALHAQTQSTPSSSSRRVRKSAAGTEYSFDIGTVDTGVYRNKGLGLSVKIPAGWVLRTEEMTARDIEDAKPASDPLAADSGKAGRVLLAAFSRPPEAAGEDVNSSILIAAESVAAYPGLKEAAQYFGPVTEIAKGQGFAVVEEPYEFLVGTKKLVRGDFQKDVGSRVMRQSTLVILARGYAVSFTFIGGTEDEVEQLIRGLSLVVGGKSGP